MRRAAAPPACFVAVFLAASLLQAQESNPVTLSSQPQNHTLTTDDQASVQAGMVRGSGQNYPQSVGAFPDGPGGETHQRFYGSLSDGPGGVDRSSLPPPSIPREEGSTDHSQSSSLQHLTSPAPRIHLGIEDLNRSSRPPGSDPALEPHVQRALKFYRLKARPSVQIALERRARLAPVILAAFDDAGVPRWLSSIALVESHYNPSARSAAGMAGMWQLESSTARHLGLKVNGKVDERLDPDRSARAVARLLKEYYIDFRDWNLALAAYSTGAYRVKKALVARPGADLPTLVRHGLLSPRLLDSVANVQAAAMIADAPEAHGFKRIGHYVAADLIADTQKAMEAVKLPDDNPPPVFTSIAP